MITLTEEQEKLVEEAVDFYYNSSEQVFQYSGKAGTGKSVVMRAIIDRLGLTLDEVAPMSYIGAAAIVMRLKGFMNAKTIHSWLFKPDWIFDYDDMDLYLNRPKKKLVFVPDKSTTIGKKIICIDEAGSVPMSLKEEIESRGIKIIACGDLNQLPPVADNPAYLYSGKVHHLTQIMRQAEGSAIIYLANRILNDEPIEPGWYGNVAVIHPNELQDDMIYNAEIVLCGTNATREYFNNKIRKMRGIDPSINLPMNGEQVICRKNNWLEGVDGINLANGLIGRVTNTPSVYGYDKDTFTIDFAPAMFPGVFKDLKCSFKYFNSSYKDKAYFKNGYYRTKGNLFELGYCITTHISQGSQFSHGIYVSEYMTRDINKHLDYTGITRFSNCCVYVLKR